ncbi:PIR protein [Plasmodium yoelii]|uniref:PIR protein n=2 Tax=Plasmodium yoelii TaxID=5861 RepID=A0AAF0B5E8_PLAYO|nr:PIR protein [Plasmodium yoelii]WBY58259.1 PIR protein [Plasmodium yoelii yoelii]CDS44863.1 YIR protein [Plasmodium yoelii]VTZ79179.1 PIR protein [Plasmodium yoelii]|eukprot:XP_022813439.1 PIR protein [Plasmodium yoelii]
MNEYMWNKFIFVRTNFTYDQNNKNYRFTNNKHFEEHCTNKCNTDIDKINAVCLHLFNELFGTSNSFEVNSKNNINIVEYIIIWLSYILSLKSHEGITNLNDFYNQYINKGDKYNKKIDDVTAYNSYKDLIDKKKNLMSIGIKDMSRFYHAFNELCNMYYRFDKNKADCKNYLKDAKNFVKKYDELNEDYNNGKDNPYNQLLSTLSNDYNRFKNICNDAQSSNFPSLPTYSRKFLIKRTLIPIAFIFVTVSIFLGIAYKYSLLGFRKRSQKQCLRERIKNIKKKMTNNI